MKRGNYIVVLLTLVLAAQVAVADRRDKDRERGRETNSAQQDGKGRRRGPHFGDWLRKNKGAPYEQQRKSLEEDPRFKDLPRERQERLLDRLRNFNNMPPEQQQRILQRMEVWEHMTPEQQQRARGVFARVRALPADRHRELVRAFRSLRYLSPDDRHRALNAQAYRNDFNDEERSMLREMLDLGIGPRERGNE